MNKLNSLLESSLFKCFLGTSFISLSYLIKAFYYPNNIKYRKLLKASTCSNIHKIKYYLYFYPPSNRIIINFFIDGREDIYFKVPKSIMITQVKVNKIQFNKCIDGEYFIINKHYLINSKENQIIILFTSLNDNDSNITFPLLITNKEISFVLFSNIPCNYTEVPSRINIADDIKDISNKNQKDFQFSLQVKNLEDLYLINQGEYKNKYSIINQQENILIEMLSDKELIDQENILNIINSFFDFISSTFKVKCNLKTFKIILSSKMNTKDNMKVYYGMCIIPHSILTLSDVVQKVYYLYLITNGIVNSFIMNKTSNSIKNNIIIHSVGIYLSYLFFSLNQDKYRNEICFLELLRHNVAMLALDIDSFSIQDIIENNIKLHNDIVSYKLGLIFIFISLFHKDKLLDIILKYLHECNSDNFFDSLFALSPVVSYLYKASKASIIEVTYKDKSLMLGLENCIPLNIELNIINKEGDIYHRKIEMKSLIQDIEISNINETEHLILVDTSYFNIMIQKFNKNEVDFIKRHLLTLISKLSINQITDIMRNLFYLVNSNIETETNNLSENEYVEMCFQILDNIEGKYAYNAYLILSEGVFFVANDKINIFSYEEIQILFNKIINIYTIKFSQIYNELINLCLDISKNKNLVKILYDKLLNNQTNPAYPVNNQIISRINLLINEYNYPLDKINFNNIFTLFPYYEKNRRLLFYQTLIKRITIFGNNNWIYFYKTVKKLKTVNDNIETFDDKNKRIIIYLILRDSMFIIDRLFNKKYNNNMNKIQIINHC